MRAKTKEIESSFDYEVSDTADGHKLRVNHCLRDILAKLYAEKELPDAFAIDVRIHRNPHVEKGQVVNRNKRLVVTAHIPLE